MGQLLRNVEFEEYGLLKTPLTWTPELAQELADQHDVGPLTEQHWAFIESLRNYYQQYHVPLPTHGLCHDLHLQGGCGHRLFHTCLDAWRIAG